VITSPITTQLVENLLKHVEDMVRDLFEQVFDKLDLMEFGITEQAVMWVYVCHLSASA